MSRLAEWPSKCSVSRNRTFFVPSGKAVAIFCNTLHEQDAQSWRKARRRLAKGSLRFLYHLAFSPILAAGTRKGRRHER